MMKLMSAQTRHVFGSTLCVIFVFLALLLTVSCEKYVTYGNAPRAVVALTDLYMVNQIPDVSELYFSKETKVGSDNSQICLHNTVSDVFLTSYEARQLCGSLSGFNDITLDSYSSPVFKPVSPSGLSEAEYLATLSRRMKASNYYETVLSYNGASSGEYNGLLTPDTSANCGTDTPFDSKASCLKSSLRVSALADLVDQISELENKVNERVREAGFDKGTAMSGPYGIFDVDSLTAELAKIEAPLKAAGEITLLIGSTDESSVIHSLVSEVLRLIAEEQGSSFTCDVALVDSYLTQVEEEINGLRSILQTTVDTTALFVEQVANGKLTGLNEIYDSSLFINEVSSVCSGVYFKGENGESNNTPKEIMRKANNVIDLTVLIMKAILVPLGEATSHESRLKTHDELLLRLYQLALNSYTAVPLLIHTTRISSHIVGVTSQIATILYNIRVGTAASKSQLSQEKDKGRVLASMVEFGSWESCHPVSVLEGCLSLSHPAYVSEGYTRDCKQTINMYEMEFSDRSSVETALVSSGSHKEITIDYKSIPAVLMIPTQNLLTGIADLRTTTIASDDKYHNCLALSFSQTLGTFVDMFFVDPTTVNPQISGNLLSSCVVYSNTLMSKKHNVSVVKLTSQQSSNSFDTGVLDATEQVLGSTINIDRVSPSVADERFFVFYKTDAALVSSCKDADGTGPEFCFQFGDTPQITRTTTAAERELVNIRSTSICLEGQYLSDDETAGCLLCPVGSYCPGDDIKHECGNKPQEGTYTDTGVSSTNCPFSCPDGGHPNYTMMTCDNVPKGMYYDETNGVLVPCQLSLSFSSSINEVPGSFFSYSTTGTDSDKTLCVGRVSGAISLKMLFKSQDSILKAIYQGTGTVGVDHKFNKIGQISHGLFELPGLFAVGIECSKKVFQNGDTPTNPNKLYLCRLVLLRPPNANGVDNPTFFSSLFVMDELWHQLSMSISSESDFVMLRRDGVIVLKEHFNHEHINDVTSTNYFKLRGEYDGANIVLGGRSSTDETTTFGHIFNPALSRMSNGLLGEVFFSDKVLPRHLIFDTTRPLAISRHVKSKSNSNNICQLDLIPPTSFPGVCECNPPFELAPSGRCMSSLNSETVNTVNSVPKCKEEGATMVWRAPSECQLIVTSTRTEAGEIKLLDGLKPKISFYSFEEKLEAESCTAETSRGMKSCVDATNDISKPMPNYKGVYGMFVKVPNRFVTAIEIEGEGDVKLEIDCNHQEYSTLILGYQHNRSTVFVGQFTKAEDAEGAPDGTSKLFVTSSSLTSDTTSNILLTGCVSVSAAVAPGKGYSLCDTVCETDEIHNDTCSCVKHKGTASTPVVQQASEYILEDKLFIGGNLGKFAVVLCRSNTQCTKTFLNSDVALGGAYFKFSEAGTFTMTVTHIIPLYLTSLPLVLTDVTVKTRLLKPTFSDLDTSEWKETQYEILRLEEKAELYVGRGHAAIVPREMSIGGSDKGVVKYIIVNKILPKSSFCVEDKTNSSREPGEPTCILVNQTYSPESPPSVVPPFTIASYIKAQEGDKLHSDSELEFMSVDLHPLYKQLLDTTERKLESGELQLTPKKIVFIYEEKLPEQLVNSLIVVVVIFAVLVIFSVVIMLIFPGWNSFIRTYHRMNKDILLSRTMVDTDEADTKVKGLKYKHNNTPSTPKVIGMERQAESWFNRYKPDNLVLPNLPFSPITKTMTKEALRLPETALDVTRLKNTNKWLGVTEDGKIEPLCCGCNSRAEMLYTCSECVTQLSDEKAPKSKMMCPTCAHDHLTHSHIIKDCVFPVCNKVMFCSICNKIKPQLYIDETKSFACQDCLIGGSHKLIKIKLCGKCQLSAASVICLTCDMNLCPSCDWNLHVVGKSTNHSRLNASIRGTSGW